MIFVFIEPPVSFSISPSCPSDVYPLIRSHQLPVLQNYQVNNLPADQTFPSPKLSMGTVKFVIDHGTPRKIAMIINIVIANGLPTAEGKQKF
jgi:hypothetical protein